MKIKNLGMLLPLFVLLVGCAPSSSSSSSSQNTSEEEITPWWKTTGELSFNEDGTVFLDEITLNLASVVAGEDKSALEDIINRFNVEYRGKINVIVENIGQDIFEKTISDRVSQGSNAPDLIMSHLKGHKTFERNQIIQPLNEAIERGKIDYAPTDIVSNLASYSDLGHKNYVFNVPVDAQSMVVFYNKQLLVKYNNGKLPEGKSELFEVAKRAKAGEGGGFTPFAVPTDESFFKHYFGRTALAQNGFSFFDKDNYKVNWGSGSNLDALVSGINSVNDFFFGDNAISTYNQSQVTVINGFTTDKSLFALYYPWKAESLLAKYGLDHGGKTISEVQQTYVGATSIAGIFQDDMNDVNAYKIYGDSHAFALTNAVEDINTKVAAAEFINYFAKDVTTAVDWAKAGHVSAVHSVRNDDEYRKNYYVENYIEAFYTDLNEFVSAGNTPFYSATFDELDTLILANIKSGVSRSDIESAAKKSSDNVNLIIEWGI